METEYLRECSLESDPNANTRSLTASPRTSRESVYLIRDGDRENTRVTLKAFGKYSTNYKRMIRVRESYVSLYESIHF